MADDSDERLTGGCLCGAVRYRLAEPPKSYGACHCAMCRKMSGGIEFGLDVTAEGVTFEDTTELKVFASSDWAERGFCGRCGSSLFWRLTAEGPMQGLFSLSAGSLDRFEGLSFDKEVYIDAKPASHAFAGERERLTEADIMAMVAAAMSEGAP